MRRSLIIEFGACGWGIERDLFPVVRLGWVLVGTYRGSMVDRLLGYQDSLRDALARLKTPEQRAREAGL